MTPDNTGAINHVAVDHFRNLYGIRRMGRLVWGRGGDGGLVPGGFHQQRALAGRTGFEFLSIQGLPVGWLALSTGNIAGNPNTWEKVDSEISMTLAETADWERANA